MAGGGTDDAVGWFVEPTLIETEDPAFRLLRDELFGPVLTALPYDDGDWDGVLDLVDRGSPYALTGAVLATDRAAVQSASDRLRNAAGNFYVNDKPTGAVVGQQPFGGARASGTNDKAGSLWNLARWTSPRAIKETFAPPTGWRYPHMGPSRWSGMLPACVRPTTERGAMSDQRTEPRTGIPAAELQERRERVLEDVRARGCSGYALFDQAYIQYLTGFWFLSTERPVAFAQSVAGEMAVFVPEFEVERVREETSFERIESYPEYPGVEHPMRIFARVVADLGLRGSIARRPGRLPGHPRLPRAGAERGDRRDGWTTWPTSSRA